MAIEPVVHPQVLTSEERGSRWQQRGVETDARFRGQACGLIWSGLAIVAAALLFSLLS